MHGSCRDDCYSSSLHQVCLDLSPQDHLQTVRRDDVTRALCLAVYAVSVQSATAEVALPHPRVWRGRVGPGRWLCSCAAALCLHGAARLAALSLKRCRALAGVPCSGSAAATVLWSCRSRKWLPSVAWAMWPRVRRWPASAYAASPHAYNSGAGTAHAARALAELCASSCGLPVCCICYSAAPLQDAVLADRWQARGC